jgi:hypothetical protein
MLVLAGIDLISSGIGGAVKDEYADLRVRDTRSFPLDFAGL